MLDRAVVNTGPLVALSLLGRLDLLPALFREILIPDVVYQKVSAGLGRPGADELQAEEWLLRVRTAPTPDPLLVAELDPGEAAVISLARQMAPCVTIIDERRGRRIATDIYGLMVRGTVGILTEARRRGLITRLRPMLVSLKDGGYFISVAVVEAACLSVAE